MTQKQNYSPGKQYNKPGWAATQMDMFNKC